MARFPTKEADIIELALAMSSGFIDNSEIYPAPPVAMTDFASLNSAYITASNAAAASQSAYEAKDEALADLVEAMKSNIRYAENTVDYDDAKLKLIGCAGRA